MNRILSTVLMPLFLMLACSSTEIGAGRDDSKKEMKTTGTICIEAGGRTFTATLADNSSAAALASLLAKGDISINMEDYAGMEKVGPLGSTLPRNDAPIHTQPGDVILYQGNMFVIYYGTNSWPLTRLGHIDNVTPAELKAALGSGNITVTISLGHKQ